MEFLYVIWQVFKLWGWILLPIILYFPAKSFYLFWLRWNVWYKEQKWVVLEIIPPEKIEKPYSAMEDIFSVFWGLYGSPDWREKWCEGVLPLAPYWISLEIASINGKIHFFIRVNEGDRNVVESSIYSHYPDAEISLVEDYTKDVPQDMPNKDWDIHGEDYKLMNDNAYPIKTYKYFEIKPEEIKGEKKLDPIVSLLEMMSELKKGEQFWLQIVAAPITNDDIPWVTKGREIADKIALRKKKKKKSVISEVIDSILWPSLESSGNGDEKASIDENLTPGEKEVLSAVETKISKCGFKTSIRSVYLAKRDAYNGSNSKLARPYFKHFCAENLNGISDWGETKTSVHYFLKKRRLYVKKRDIFTKYIKRLPPKWPDMIKGTSVLNPEELASIYRFPINMLISAAPKAQSRKADAPPDLPT